MKTTMKMKMKLFVLSILLLSIARCKESDRMVEFEMDYTERVTVPASSGLNLPFDLFTPEVETNSESTFAVNDTRKDLIEEIKLKSIKIKLISPNNEDFSFLESINVCISSDELAEIKIAWKEDIGDESSDEVYLLFSDTDLKEYIKKDEFTLRVNTVTDEAISRDHEIEITSDFRVKAKIIGE